MSHMPERYTNMPKDREMCKMPLAMAWFEYQVFKDVYDPEKALEQGTLFPELDKPWFAGGRSQK